MKKGDLIICPNCKGRKYVYDHLFGAFTLGMGYLVGPNSKCKTCNGRGFVEV